MRVKKLYAFYDVNMQMFTDPCTLRNDVEAKKLFKSLLDKDHFNGCPVELYCLADFAFDNNPAVCPIEKIVPRKIFLEDTLEDDEESDQD